MGRSGDNLFDRLFYDQGKPLLDDQSGYLLGKRAAAHLSLPAVARGVPFSRQMVRDLCGLLGMTSIADVAELLASELITNAVLHARTFSVEVSVEAKAGQLLVSVGDSDHNPPTMRAATPDSLGGRGLHLLDALAQEWGVDDGPAGKTVWFALAATGASPAHQPHVDGRAPAS